MLKVGFLGGGKMAQALAKGFIQSGLCRGETIMASCLPTDKTSIESFNELGSKTVFENSLVADYGDVLILSVKPQVVPKVLPELSSCQRKLLLSIAMGVSISTLEEGLPRGMPVIRVMTNTPALVGKAATVFIAGSNATGGKYSELTEKLFSSVGTCERIGDESLMDVITALSGAGPAYVYMLIESLADGAVKMGMSRELAYRLASQTVVGAGEMVRQEGSHPGKLKDDVASPGGCTISAIHHLEQHGFRSALIGAIEAATLRSKSFH